ncbi:MAG: hypothetical protein OCD00_06385 [Colwellia sp.]
MKNNIITLILLNIIIVTIITGCGGGGEDNSEIKTVESAPSVEEVTEEVITTSDLISEPDFDFISSVRLDVILPPSPSTVVRYFLNICTDYSEENGEVEINYDSCKLRASLTTQEQLFSLSLSSAEFRLIAQIWPIENGSQPINIYWNISESGNSWKIAI